MDEAHCLISAEHCSEILEADYNRIKSNLKNIIESVRYCGICLANHNIDYFYTLDFTAAHDDGNVSLEQMVCNVFGDQIVTDIVSENICSDCMVEVKKLYFFRCKVKNNLLILNTFLKQINQQVKVVEDITNSPTCNIANVIISINGLECLETLKEADKKPFEVKSELICDYCKKSFRTKASLKTHITKLHMGLKRTANILFNTKCDECLNSPCIHQKYLESLKAQRLAGNKLLQCIDCDYQHVKVGFIISHVNREHLNLFPYLCDTCGSSFPSKNSHMAHVKRYHVAEKPLCQFCDRKFANQEVLEYHMVQCQDTTRSHVCKSCPASFNSVQSLQLHQKKHLNSFQCNMCLKVFPTHMLLLRHKSTVHIIFSKPPKRPRRADRMCSICPAKFTTLNKLKVHMATHGPNEKHKCDICNKSFNSRTSYCAHTRSYPHMRRLNPNINFTFSCTDCSESFPSNIMLENHRNVVHLKIKPYSCHTCGKGFTTAQHLKHHLLIHEGVKNYKCSHCSIMLTTLSSLKKHVLRQHSEKKPFACDMCDRSFVCKSERLMHTLKTHSDIKVPCPVCGGKFRHRSNVKSHIYKVHLRDKDLQELLEEHKDNEELMDFMRDRRKPFVENVV